MPLPLERRAHQPYPFHAMALHELVYVSLACSELPEDELVAILDLSRRKNKERNISGMLTYHRREFVQILEGERDQVEALFAKIAEDPRHQQVHMLWDGPIEKRSFAEWTMAFVSGDGLDLEQREGYTSLFNLELTTSARDNTGKRFLQGLRDDFL